MTEQVINVDFNLASNINKRHEKQHENIAEEILIKMALSICPSNTNPTMIPPSIINEAWKIYQMVGTMGIELQKKE